MPFAARHIASAQAIMVLRPAPLADAAIRSTTTSPVIGAASRNLAEAVFAALASHVPVLVMPSMPPSLTRTSAGARRAYRPYGYCYSLRSSRADRTPNQERAEIEADT